MSKGINLASPHKKSIDVYRYLFLSALGLFILVFIISAVTVSYRLFLGNQLAVLESDEKSIITTISSLQEKKEKFLVVKERLSQISKIVGKRADVNSRIDVVVGILPPPIEVDKISGSVNEVSISVSSPSLQTLNELVEENIAELVASNNRSIKRIEMRSFRLDSETLIYSATINVEFK